MIDFKQFLLPIARLALGIHKFEFKIDKEFFNKFEYSEIREAKFTIHVLLDKKTSVMEINFDIEGSCNVMCDRCAGDLDLPIKTSEKLIVKFGSESIEEADEVLMIPNNEKEFDISQYIYEYIVLALPQSRIHPKGKCDKEVIKKLKELSPQKDSQNTADDRWAALKNIKLN